MFTEREKYWLSVFSDSSDNELKNEKQMLLLQSHNNELQAFVNELYCERKKREFKFDELMEKHNHLMEDYKKLAEEIEELSIVNKENNELQMKLISCEKTLSELTKVNQKQNEKIEKLEIDIIELENQLLITTTTQ